MFLNPLDFVPYILVAVASLLSFLWVTQKKNLPPGPYGLPIVGYLPFLGEDVSAQFSELSKKYGSIFSLRLGRNLVVMLNDYDAMKEILGDPNSLDRAPIFDSFLNLGFGTKNGEEWQEQRRFTLQIARELGIGKSQWEQSIREKINSFCGFLERHQDCPVEYAPEVRRCMINSIISLLIGRNLKSSEEQIAVKYLDFAFTGVGTASYLSQLLFLGELLRYIPFSDYYNRYRHVNKFQNLVENEVSDHAARLEYGEGDDFIDLYLKQMKKMTSTTKKHYFSEHNLMGNVNVMFFAAVDTTYQTSLWLFHLMARYPDVQSRVQAELDDVIGDSGTISYEGRIKVPYTVSVILETLRYSSIVPISDSRSAVSDFDVRGYRIPKGTQISANLKAINYDPKYWDEPEAFKPERFLKNGGKSFESNPPSYAPFSFGRRNCPGDKIAWMELMILFTTICQQFTIRAPPGEEVHFHVEQGLVNLLKPQTLHFTRRGTK